MPPELTTSTPKWTALEGKVLEGGYEVEQCLQSGPHSASFGVRVLGDRFTDAIVNVFAVGARSLDQFGLWNDALELTHPNLSPPLAVGQLDWDGTSLPYLVLRNAPENLAAVVTERVLTPDEAQELSQSAANALEYLHSRGLVHACLSPEEVFAVGNSIRLSTTGIRKINTPVTGWQAIPKYQAPESAGENLTTASDVWCLGATLFEVLSQKVYSADCRVEAESLPQPFNVIVVRCLEQDPQSRCTLASVQAMLRGEQLEPAAMPQAVLKTMVAAAGGGFSGSGATAPVQPVIPRTAMPRLAAPAKPVFTEPPPSQPEAMRQEPRRQELIRQGAIESPRSRFWSYAILGMVLLACLIWLVWPTNLRQRPPVTPNALPSGVQPMAQRSATDSLPGSQSHVIEPFATTTSAATTSSPAKTLQAGTARERVASAGTPAIPGRREVWRVVVYTFARRGDAESRVRIINQKRLGFSPEVFLGNGRGPYLVVVGGQMSRNQATETRRKARKAGLPSDSYIQNFDR